MSLSSHQRNGGHDEWLTPPEIVGALGAFDLDPCSPINRPWPTASLHYTVEDDGLSKAWGGRVWCNPPFGREAVKWLRKLAQHGDGVALIPARTETAMFYECVWGVADAVLFMRGRPHFHYVDGTRADANSGAPICLVAYGVQNVKALINSRLGTVVPAATLEPTP
ncbi:MAG: DNA N-6-adenine-methyltransferase [Pseudomonadota bacterium]